MVTVGRGGTRVDDGAGVDDGVGGEVGVNRTKGGVADLRGACARISCRPIPGNPDRSIKLPKIRALTAAARNGWPDFTEELCLLLS